MQTAIGGKHPVAGDKERNRVASQRLSDGLCGARLTHRGRHLTVTAGPARTDGSRRRVDLAIEVGGAVQIQPGPLQIIVVAGEHAANSVNRLGHEVRWRQLAARRTPDPGKGRGVVAFGQL